MHVVDRRLLLAHLEGEYVADRDHAGKAALGHDGQMADPLPRHHSGAFLDRRVGRAGRDRRRHDVRHLGRGGIAPRRDHATQDVALGEDADQPPALVTTNPPMPRSLMSSAALSTVSPGFTAMTSLPFRARMSWTVGTPPLPGWGLLDTTAPSLGAPPYPVHRRQVTLWRRLVSTSARSMRTPARSPARSRSSAVSPRSTASSRHSGFSPGSYARP